jgi:hypothetical protein
VNAPIIAFHEGLIRFTEEVCVTRNTEGSSVSHGGKVPAVKIGFWAIKIVATTLGEVGGNAVFKR